MLNFISKTFIKISIRFICVKTVYALIQLLDTLGINYY